jgi:hypothetical protein
MSRATQLGSITLMMIDEVSLGPAVILETAHLSSDLWLRSLGLIYGMIWWNALTDQKTVEVFWIT